MPEQIVFDPRRVSGEQIAAVERVIAKWIGHPLKIGSAARLTRDLLVALSVVSAKEKALKDNK